MADESRLILSVDGSGARRDIAATERALASVENQGDETAESFDDLQKETEETTMSFGDMKSAVAGVVSAMGAYTLARNIKETIDYYDELGKLNARFNISVESLDNLRFVAERSGLSFRQIQNAVQYMMRSVDEARNGIVSYAEDFQKLNINLEEFALLSPEEQFRVLSQRLENTRDDMERVNVAAGIFGRSAGPAMLQVIGQGVEAFDALIDNADEFTDSVSRGAAAAAEQFNDSLTNLNGSMRQVYNEIAQAFMPTLTDLFNFMARIIPRGIRITQAAFNQLMAEINAFLGNFAQGLSIISDWIPGLDVLSDSLEEVAQGYAHIGQTYANQAAEQLREATADFEHSEGAIRSTREQLAQLADGYVPYERNANKATKATKELADAHVQLRQELMDSAEAVRLSVRTAEETYFESIEELNRLRHMMTEETYSRALDKLQTEYYDEISNAEEELYHQHEDNMKRMDRSTERFTNSFSSLISGMVQDGEFDLRKFASFFINEFMRSITSSIGGASAGGGGGIFSSIFGAIGSMFGGGAPAGTARFATGTDYVPRTGLAVVHQGEQIIPAGRSAAPSVSVQVINQGTPQTVTAQEERFDAGQMVLRIVTEDLRTGGAVARTMENTYGVRRG